MVVPMVDLTVVPEKARRASPPESCGKSRFDNSGRAYPKKKKKQTSNVYSPLTGVEVRDLPFLPSIPARILSADASPVQVFLEVAPPVESFLVPPFSPSRHTTIVGEQGVDLTPHFLI
jgi:hypothetical protein